MHQCEELLASTQATEGKTHTVELKHDICEIFYTSIFSTTKQHKDVSKEMHKLQYYEC